MGYWKIKPEDCEHEWLVDTSVILTSSPPRSRVVCCMCGSISSAVGVRHIPTPRWIRLPPDMIVAEPRSTPNDEDDQC